MACNHLSCNQICRIKDRKYNGDVQLKYNGDVSITIAMVIMHDSNQSVTLANVMTRHAKFQRT